MLQVAKGARGETVHQVIVQLTLYARSILIWFYLHFTGLLYETMCDRYTVKEGMQGSTGAGGAVPPCEGSGFLTAFSNSVCAIECADDYEAVYVENGRYHWYCNNNDPHDHDGDRVNDHTGEAAPDCEKEVRVLRCGSDGGASYMDEDRVGMVELLCVKKGTVLVVDENKKHGKKHGKKEGKKEGKGDQIVKAVHPANVNGGSDDDVSAVALAIAAGLAGVIGSVFAMTLERIIFRNKLQTSHAAPVSPVRGDRTKGGQAIRSYTC